MLCPSLACIPKGCRARILCHPVSLQFSWTVLVCPSPSPWFLNWGGCKPGYLTPRVIPGYVLAPARQASSCVRDARCAVVHFSRIFTWVRIQGLGLLGIVDDDTITAIASDFSLASTGVGSPRNAHCDLDSSRHGEVLSSHLTDTEVIVVEAAAEARAASGHQAPLKFEVRKVVLRY